MKKTKNTKNPRVFAKASTQSRELSKALYNSNSIASLGTSYSYEASLKLAAEWLQKNGRGSLYELSPKSAMAYLRSRLSVVGQKTLDRDRQALQAVLRQNGRLTADQRLHVVEATRQQSLKSRNYTKTQIDIICQHQSARNSFSTEIAFEAGLRAHELLTLLPASERPASERPADSLKFRDGGSRYTVVGKGGLIREVRISTELAVRLESTRLKAPIDRIDRKIHYNMHYDIAGGQSWSQSFSSASKSALGYSTGGHGLRHTYAQDRNREAQRLTGDIQRAKEIVSQELGHFRPEITNTYLR